jgi:hypothetical protein
VESQTRWVPFSRQFVPSKRVVWIELAACRRSSATGVNGRGTWYYFDNPYTR